MTATTGNNMKFLAMEDDSTTGFRLPNEMKGAIELAAKKQKMNKSKYMKLATIEKIDRDNNQ